MSWDRKGKIEHSHIISHSICSPTQDSAPLWFLLSQNQWPNSSMSLATFIAALLSPFGWLLQLVLQTPGFLPLLSSPICSSPPTSLLPNTIGVQFLPHPRVQGSRLTSPALHQRFPGPTRHRHTVGGYLLNCPQALVTGDDQLSKRPGLPPCSCLGLSALPSLTDTGSWAVWACGSSASLASSVRPQWTILASFSRLLLGGFPDFWSHLGNLKLPASSHSPTSWRWGTYDWDESSLLFLSSSGLHCPGLSGVRGRVTFPSRKESFLPLWPSVLPL